MTLTTGKQNLLLYLLTRSNFVMAVNSEEIHYNERHDSLF